MNLKIQVKTPAKLMLFGEYCVLWGQESLAFTPNLHMSLSIENQLDGPSLLESDLWPEPVKLGSASFHEYAKGSLFLELISEIAGELELPPFKISVKSGWAVEDGLGSSSALVLSCFAACRAFAKALEQGQGEPKGQLSESELWALATQVYQFQRRKQGFASGYDIATQTKGGFVRFSGTAEHWPGKIETYPKLAQRLPQIIHIFRGGQGAPTRKVGQSTLDWIAERQLKEQICANDRAAQSALIIAFHNGNDQADMTKIITATANHRKLFEASPSFPKHILDLLENLDGFDKTFSFKTTGAGGEDAILLVGLNSAIQAAKEKLESISWQRIDYQCTDKGLSIDTVFRED